MKLLKKLIKTEKQHEMLLTALFILYILFDIQLPTVLANLVDSLTGNIVVALLALSVFVYTNPIIGILAFIVAYLMVRRSSSASGSYAMKHYLPSEKTKQQDFLKYNQAAEFSKYNDFPDTLEQEVVAKMAPLEDNTPEEKSTFKPIQCPGHDAAPIDYDGVV